MDMEQLFQQCRFSKRYQGYYAFRECLSIALENEETLLYMTGIYVEAGQRCHAPWQHVERNIRTMLNYSWKNGGKEVLEMLSGGVLYQKPTVSEVIEILTCYLKEHPEIPDAKKVEMDQK